VVFGYPCTDNDGAENTTQYPGCGPISCPASRPDIHKSIISPNITISPDEKQEEKPNTKSEALQKVDKNTKPEQKKQIK
jgi:hypothetical protein